MQIPKAIAVVTIALSVFLIGLYNQALNKHQSATVVNSTDIEAPSIPSGLGWINLSGNEIVLGWKNSTDNVGVAGYRVYRGIPPGSTSLIATVTSPLYDDKDLTPSTLYSYEISAFDDAGNESLRPGIRLTTIASASTPITVAPVTPPAPAPVVVTPPKTTSVVGSSDTPQNVVITPDKYLVTLSWTGTNNPAIEYYKIYYSNGTFIKSSTATTGVIDNNAGAGLSAGTSYSYQISAYGAGQESPKSAIVSATTLPFVANPPIIITSQALPAPYALEAREVSTSSIALFWKNISSGYDPKRNITITDYIYRNNVLIGQLTLPHTLIPSSQSAGYYYKDTGLLPGTSYTYTIKEVASAPGGQSPLSSPLLVTTLGTAPLTGNFVSVKNIGTDGSDFGMAIALDSSGNRFVGGNMAGSPVLTKISPNGSTLWQLGLANAGIVQSVATTPGGDVVFTGYFSGTVDFGGGNLTSGGTYDIFVAKYSSDGRYVWAYNYGSNYPIDWAGDEIGSGIAVNANNGNIAVVGSYLDNGKFGTVAGSPVNLTSNGGKDGFLLLLNPNGTSVWAKSLGSAAADDSVTSVTFDTQGAIVVGGRYGSSVNFGSSANPTIFTSIGSYDSFVAKYAPSDGGLLWVKSFGGSDLDSVYGVAVDPLNNVIATGYYRATATFGTTTLTSAGFDDIFLIKYSGTGTQQWVKSFGSYIPDFGNSVAVDSNRDITLVGRLGAPINFGGGLIGGQRPGQNIFVSKFASTTGSYIWSKAYGNGREEARSVAIDTVGYSYTVGKVSYNIDFGGGPIVNNGPDGSTDIFVLKLAP